MCTETTIVPILHFGHRRKCLLVSAFWDLAIVFPVEVSNPHFMTANIFLYFEKMVPGKLFNYRKHHFPKRP
jgi:hypothetical protein